MSVSVKYINHLGEEFDFPSNGVNLQEGSIYDYEWSFDTVYEKAVNFRKKMAKKTLELLICGKDEETAVELKNRIHELFEKDIQAEQEGKLYVGEYYSKCFIYGSKKSKYMQNTLSLVNKLSAVWNNPAWIKEKHYSFLTDAETEAGIDFPFDFSFDFTSALYSRSIENTSFTASNFKAIIYGPVVNPVFYVANHQYQVNTTLETGDYLVIDSIEKTIVRTKKNGTVINDFSLRYKPSYIFELIATGANSVVWDGTYGIDFVIYDERGEPTWT